MKERLLGVIASIGAALAGVVSLSGEPKQKPNLEQTLIADSLRPKVVGTINPKILNVKAPFFPSGSRNENPRYIPDDSNKDGFERDSNYSATEPEQEDLEETYTNNAGWAITDIYDSDSLLVNRLTDTNNDGKIEGEYMEGYSVSKTPKLNQSFINKYIKNAKPVSGLYAEVGNVEEYLQSAGILGIPGNIGTGDFNSEEYQTELAGTLGSIGGGLKGAGMAYAFLAGTPISLTTSMGTAGSATIASSTLTGTAGISELAGSTWAGSAGMSAFAGAAMAYGGALAITNLVASWLKIGPQGALVASIASVVATSIALFAFKTSFLAAGIWGIVIGVLAALILKFLGIGDTREINVKFNCNTWQPPIGGSDCEKCNNQEFPCSEYRCKSLGTACELINKGSVDIRCIDDNPNDVTPPTIEPALGIVSESEQYVDISAEGFRISRLDSNCLDAYDELTFGIKTSEPAQCKFDLEMKEFDEMEFYFGSNTFVENHTANLVLPDPSHGQSQGINFSEEQTLYVKCMDTHGNLLPSFYSIEMCINQGEDITPPLIKSTDPLSGSLISFNKTNQEVTIYTNEPSNCKWDLADVNYGLMQNSMSCENNLQDITIYGYMCNSSFETSSAENKFYIRCKDQPWLDVEGSGNANVESFEYILRKPEKHLEIDWVEPFEDFEVASVPTTVILKVQTSGGGEYPECSYSFLSYDNLITFYNTYTSTHEQEFSLIQGDKTIYIECVDETGDSAREEVSFKIIKDVSVPQIARIYQETGFLKVITTEAAECRYSEDSCNFVFSEGIDIGSGGEHSISVIQGESYYIKCKDEHGNVPSGCSIIAKAV